MKKSAIVCVATLAATICAAPGAHAQTQTLTWSPESGQAIAIAVGANNVPWVLGRGGAAYFGSPTPCTTNICPQQRQMDWNSVGGVATNLAVDLDGQLWTSYHGTLTFLNQLFGLSSITTTGLSCTSSFAVAEEWQSNPRLSDHMIAPPFGGTTIWPTFWGTDCTSAGNLWQLNANFTFGDAPMTYTTKLWNEVDTGDHQVALFSANSGTTVTQVPWITTRGQVWVFNGSTFSSVVAPGYVTYITDHYAVTSAGVYYWNGPVNGHGTGIAAFDWRKVIGQTPSAPIAQVAYAAATLVNTTVGDIGPSGLWAVDTAFNIYSTRPLGIAN